MFTGAMIIVTIVRAIVIKETLVNSGTGKTESPLMNRDLWKTFRSQPRTIYAMLGVAVISRFAMLMTWTFLTPYAINVAGLTLTQYGMLQSIAMGISEPLPVQRI
jgi:flagellar biosynthesis/type III secretory pathway M-ring protein FliF/YscJ